MDVDRLARMFGKRLVNGLTVEVGASDVAFEGYVISGFGHGGFELHRKLTAIYRREIRKFRFFY